MVGCAVLRALTVNHGWRCLLLEASPHLASGASSGNTGIACTASDVAPGTLEHKCLQTANKLNLSTYRELNVPHRATGSIYVAHSDEDVAVLTREQATRAARGDSTPRMLSADEARRIEPSLDATVTGALLLPDETVVDPWLVPMAWARHAHENGATIRREAEVTQAERLPDRWRLTLSSTAPVQEEARLVVACGGLRGDTLEGLHRPPPFAIKPRRGDFVLFDAAASMGETPVGGVPSATSRGVYTWRSVHGVVACGVCTHQGAQTRGLATRSVPCSLRSLLAACQLCSD